LKILKWMNKAFNNSILSNYFRHQEKELKE